MKYNFDSLHIEIDNSAAELGLDPFDTLDIWHMGIKVWKTKNEQNCLLFKLIRLYFYKLKQHKKYIIKRVKDYLSKKQKD